MSDLQRQINHIRRWRWLMMESNCCTLTALCLTTGVSYIKGWIALWAAGRKWREGTTGACLHTAITMLGFEVYECSCPMNTDLLPLLSKGRYLVYLPMHVGAVIDGCVVDSSAHEHLYHSGKIDGIYQVCKRNETEVINGLVPIRTVFRRTIF